MGWKPIDFQGIISVDSALVPILKQYLEDQEERLAKVLINSIPESTSEHKPLIPSSNPPVKLADALELFDKHRNYQNGHHQGSRIALNNWTRSVNQINKALWHYVEVLEGCVTELFIQLEQISLDQWHGRLANVLNEIKDTLVHKMEELIWGIKRLENQLWKFRFACEESHSLSLKWLKLKSLGSSILDKSLVTHLEKNQELLRSQYQKFIKRYRAYRGLLEQVQTHVEKLSHYHILNALDPEINKQFLQIYELLKLWELNKSFHALPEKDFFLALRNLVSGDRALGIFREYYKALRNNLFEKSQLLKQDPKYYTGDAPGKELIEDLIMRGQAENHTLGATVSNYRTYLLNSDPNPYVRTRLGFSDRIAGPEPAQTKPLLNLGYDVEALSELYDRLAHAIKDESAPRQEALLELRQEIETLLHEIGQPLATYRMMRNKTESLLEKIQQMDELGSYEASIVPFIGKTFAKLFRADWKYHVAFGIPLFHELYVIHQGIAGPLTDRVHDQRLKHFQKLIHQIQDWVKEHKTHSHLHEIELDMSDIQGYLQDFFGYVQRVCSEQNLTQEQAEATYTEIAKALLDYRYLFGNFFYQLRQNETDGPLIRRQFLFVDQYFESIEAKLYELEHSHGFHN